MSFIPTPADFMTVQDFKDNGEWPLPYVSTAGLVPYIKRAKAKNVLELGTARGEGAIFLLEECPEIEYYVTVDQYKEYMDWNGKIEQSVLDNFKSIAKKNFADFSTRVEVVEANTQDRDCYDALPDDYFDVLFIDADHSEKAVYNDIMNFYGKVRKGGIIAVHDTNLLSVLDGAKKARDELKDRSPLNRVKNGAAFWNKK